MHKNKDYALILVLALITMAGVSALFQSSSGEIEPLIIEVGPLPPPENVERTFGNSDVPDLKDIIVENTVDFLIVNNADGLVFKFATQKDKFNEIYQDNTMIVKDEKWLIYWEDKEGGSTVGIDWEIIENYNVRVTQFYEDKKSGSGSDYEISWDFYGGLRPKITVKLEASTAGDYKINWRASLYKTYAENLFNYVRFYDDEDNENIVFDYSDVYSNFGNITNVGDISGWFKGKRFDLYFDIGHLDVENFVLDPNFGYEGIGVTPEWLVDAIKGTWFTSPELGLGKSISVNLDVEGSGAPVKCAIYKRSDNTLIGSTEEIAAENIVDGWNTFNFLDPKPNLEAIDYWIVAWASGDEVPDNLVKMRYFADVADKSFVEGAIYDGWPDPLDTSSGRAYIWAIYATYTPTVVGTSTTYRALDYPYQQKMFIDNWDNIWLFYSNGTNMVYRISNDEGITWGSEWIAETSVGDGRDFSVIYDGENINYAFVSGGALYYQRGVPMEDGNIGVLYSTQTVYPKINSVAYYPTATNLVDNIYEWSTSAPPENMDTVVTVGTNGNDSIFIINPFENTTEPIGTTLPSPITLKGWRSANPVSLRPENGGSWDMDFNMMNVGNMGHSGSLWHRLWKSKNADMSSAENLCAWKDRSGFTFVGEIDNENKRYDFLGDSYPITVDNEYIYVEFAWEVNAENLDASTAVCFKVESTNNVIYTPNYSAKQPTIAIESDGRPWIAWGWYYSAGGTQVDRPYVVRSTTSDGSWATDNGNGQFPIRLKRYTDYTKALIVSLTGGKMYAIYGEIWGNSGARLWDGSSWGDWEEPMSALELSFGYSVVAEGDDIHMAFNKDVTYDLTYNKRVYGSGWQTENTIYAGTNGDYVPSLAIDTLTGDLFCFWYDDPVVDKIYYSKRRASTGSWDASETFFFNEENGFYSNNSWHLISSKENMGDEKYGLAWVSQTSSPYDVVFELFEEVPQVPTDLLCEGQINPTQIIDNTPEFSAIGYDKEGDNLASYELQVDSSSNFSSPFYNKGKTALTPFGAGTRSGDISYENTDLVRETTYYWRIKFWDNNDTEGNWSVESATFKINQLPIAENQEVDNQTNPNRVVTLTPVLSWDYYDTDGDTQENYWIQVGTSENDNSMWDKIGESFDNFVTYLGNNNFGYGTAGASSTTFKNVIRGSWASGSAGIAESITANLGNWEVGENVKFGLYKKSDNSFVGETEERSDGGAGWETFFFITQPTLEAIDYWIVAWSDSIVGMRYDTETDKGLKDSETYGAWPDPIVWSPAPPTEDWLNSIYVTYTKPLSRGIEYYWRVKVNDNYEWSENWLYGGTFQINQLPITENTKTEGFVNPENVDTQAPTFTWDYFDNDSDTQSNWQIQVGLSENENDKWDFTGSGSDALDTYAGSPLDDSVTYYVRVRTKDSYGWSGWDNGTFKTSYNTFPQIVWIIVDNALVDRKQDDENTNPILQTRITVRGWDNDNRDDLISLLLSFTDNDGNYIIENENITDVHENIDNNTRDYYYDYNPSDVMNNTALGGFKVKAILTDSIGDNASENFIEIKFYVDDLTVTIENSIYGENLVILGKGTRTSGVTGYDLDNVYLVDNGEGPIGTILIENAGGSQDIENYENTYQPSKSGKVYARANLSSGALDGVSDNVTYEVINLLIENSYFGGTQDNATLWVELKYSDALPLENVSIQLSENNLRVVFDNENRISWTFDLQDDNENIQLTLENVVDNRTDKVVYMGYVKDNILYVENTTADFEIYGRTKSIYYGQYGFFTGSIISKTNWINLDLEGKLEKDGFLADGENYVVEPQETMAWSLSHNPTETMDYVLGFYGSLYQSWTVSIFVERRVGSPGAPAYHPSYFLKFEVVDTFLAPLIAQIKLYRDAMLIKSAYTNQDGIYSFYLPAGDYSVEISKEGYEMATIPEFVLGADTAMDEIVLEETLPEPPKGAELPLGIMAAVSVAIAIVVISYILLLEYGKKGVPKQ